MSLHRVAAVGAAAVVLVSGCGGVGASTTHGDRTPGSPTSRSTSPRSTSSNQFNSGIVGASCSETAVSLFAIPQEGGSFKARKDLTLPAGVSPTFGCDDSPYAFRQSFNKDFTRMAVTITNPADSSQHVGYLDVGSGRLVDLDAHRTGSSFQAAAQDHSPVFDPATGDIWFVSGRPNGLSTGKIMKVAAGGGAAVETGQAFKYAGSDSFVLAGRSGRIVVPDSSNVLPLPNPAGTVTAAYNSIGGRRLGAALTLVDPNDPAGGHGYQENKLLSLEGPALPAGGLTPMVWVNDDTLLTSVDISTISSTTANSMQLFRFNTQHSQVLGTHRVLPDSDRTNRSPVISPDKKRLAFLSFRGATGGLYIVRLGAHPAQPAEVPSAYPAVLLEWR